MGSGEVEETSTSRKVIDYLFELGAYAISIGMPSQEYWEDDPDRLKCYINAEKIRQKKINSELWLQGLYVYQAIGCLVPVLNPFSKDHKAKPYLKEPLPLNEEEKQQQFERKVESFLNGLVGLKPKEGG